MSWSPSPHEEEREQNSDNGENSHGGIVSRGCCTGCGQGSSHGSCGLGSRGCGGRGCGSRGRGSCGRGTRGCGGRGHGGCEHGSHGQGNRGQGAHGGHGVSGESSDEDTEWSESPAKSMFLNQLGLRVIPQLFFGPVHS